MAQEQGDKTARDEATTPLSGHSSPQGLVTSSSSSSSLAPFYVSTSVTNYMLCVTVGLVFFVLLWGIQVVTYLCVARRRSYPPAMRSVLGRPSLGPMQRAMVDKRQVFYISKLWVSDFYSAWYIIAMGLWRPFMWVWQGLLHLFVLDYHVLNKNLIRNKI